jgi:hypothetical protein
MSGRRPFNQAPGHSLEDRARQRQAELDRRAALTSAMAATAARRAATPAPSEPDATAKPQRDVEAYMNALNALPLYRLGSTEELRLTTIYRRLVRSAAEVANDGSAQVVMSWPLSQTCPTAVVTLLAIGAVASAKRTTFAINGTVTDGFERADEVRAVLFPYARSTHAPAREVQVNRATLGAMHFDHLKRFLNRNDDPAVKDYHQVLSRVRLLTGRAVDGRDYAEFQHPILDELVPHGPPKGDRASNSELLWRTKSKTDIGKQTRSGDADDPTKAGYYIYTIRASERISAQLQAIKTAPDLLLLDLSRTGRGRLGWNWQSRVREIVDRMREAHPTSGILAITDDPWTYQAARFDLLGSKNPGRKGRTTPATSHVVFARETSIVGNPEHDAPTFQGAARISVDGFYGEVDRTIEQLRRLGRQLTDLGDGVASSTVRDVIGTLRRSACLPGTLAAFSRFLDDETTTAMAADLLASYRVATDVATLNDPRGLASQADAKNTTASALTVMRSFERATPMASLLDDAIQPSLRSSSKSVVIFRSDMIAEFATAELSPRHPKLVERLDNGVIRFGGARIIATLAATAPSARNQFKRVILVAPTRSGILAMFAEPWLPEQVAVLADADTLAFAARDAERLSEELGDGEVSKRLREFSSRAKTRVSEIGRHAVQLDTDAPLDDVEFPNATLVDLSGGGRGERKLLEIHMNNGQRILARRSTAIVLRNAGAATTAFIEKPASNVRTGDEVCVIGPAFVERARTVVNIRATAAAEIREYHQQVITRFSQIPAASVSERLRVVVATMGEPRVSPDTARYWVDLDQEADKSLHEVVPHAPLERDTFLRFTAALGIGQKLAENFWLWAVVAQRSHRMRAGNVFHDAFRGILTDPHAALAENSGRTDDIRALRSMAEEHVATVADVRSVNTT